MLPMVTVPAELAAAAELLDGAVNYLSASGVPCRRPPLGMMVEVPAAAVEPQLFVRADFFSIGSNDLTQYVTASARDNSTVAALCDPLQSYVRVVPLEPVAMKTRKEMLEEFVAEDASDSFSRYALALEYVKAGQTDDARREFEFVRDNDPAYVATYFQLAQLYRNLGLKHDAEKTYRSGITVASKAGDGHTQSELEGALESLLME